MRLRVVAVVVVAVLVVAASPASAAYGDVEWSHTENSNVVDGVDSNGTAVFSTGSGSTEAVKASDGSSEWSSGTGGQALDEANGTVAVAEDGTSSVVALSAADGSQEWSHSQHSSTSVDVAANDSYVASAGIDDLVFANANDGSIKWSNAGQFSGTNVEGEAVGIGDGTVVATQNGDVYGLAASDGTQLWSSGFNYIDTEGDVNAVVVNGSESTAYLANDNEITALNTSDGSERWSEQVTSSTLNDIALSASGTLVVAAENGDVIAFDPADRKELLTVNDGSTADAAGVDSNHWYGGYNGKVTAFNTSKAGSLFIRDEQNPDELVRDTTTVNVTLETADGTTVEKQTSDYGVVDIAAIGSGPVVARVDADGWLKRSIIVDNTSSASTIYLLNSSADAATVTFELDDKTGNYPTEESSLYISRALNRSGSTEYREVTSGDFEADSTLTVPLESGANYRLRVENEDGDQRELGGFSSSTDRRAILEIGEFSFDVNSSGRGYEWDARIENVSTNNGPRDKLIFEFDDPEDQTSTLDVVVYEKDNESNEILNKTYTNLGSARYAAQLSKANRNKTWVAYINGTRDGENINGQKIIGKTDLDPGVPLDPFYQEMFSVLILFVLAGVFGGVRAEAGAIVVAMTAGVLFYAGWLPNTISAGMIIVALFIAVLYRIQSTPQPG